MGDHGDSRGPYRSLQKYPFMSMTLSDDLAKAPSWQKHRDTLKQVLSSQQNHRKLKARGGSNVDGVATRDSLTIARLC